MSKKNYEWVTEGWIDSIKNSIISEIDKHGKNTKKISKEINSEKKVAEEDYEKLRKVTIEHNRQSINPHDVVDSQGIINDHYDDELYNRAYGYVNKLENKYMELFYNLTIGTSELEDARNNIESQNLKDKITDSLNEIEEYDNSYMK